MLKFNNNILKSYSTKNYKMSKLSTNLIVAVDSKWGISNKGMIPWRFKEDSLFFQDVTKREYVKGKKNAIILGKNSWKALPDTFRGLKDRINIVVSSSMTPEELVQDNKTLAESYLVKSLNEGIDLCQKIQPGKIFIGGGNNIYKESLEKNLVDEVYLTQIDADYKCDNTLPFLSKVFDNFKTFSSKQFVLTDQNHQDKSNKANVTFTKLYRDELPIHLNVNKEEQQYLDLLENILRTGNYRKGRNGYTWSKFGKHMEFDLSKGFPILTTKKINFYAIFEELLWFLKGDTNSKNLSEKGIKIWDGNTTREFLDSVGLTHLKEGEIGPMYGFQLLNFNAPYKGAEVDYTGKGFNQIEYCLNLLKKDPFSRRILMTTYNPAQANEGCLFPCHGISIIFNVEEGHKLSCMMTQRSIDSICGLQFNLSSYSLLVHMLCEILNNDENYNGDKFSPGRLIMNLADTHIYESHKEQAIRQILREPREFPQLKFKRKVKDLKDFKFEDLELIDYQFDPYIPVKMVA